MADQKFKSKVKLEGGVNLPTQTSGTVPVINGSNDLVSSSVTSTELSYLSGVTSSVQTQLNDVASDISDHLSDASDAHDASAISNVPSGNLAATDIQAAVDELQSDIDTRATITALNNHINDTSGAHAASAISNAPSGNLAATDVQAALDELQLNIDDVQDDVDDLVSLSGVAANATNLGTFTGTTIPDSSTIKGALQALETELDGIPSPFYYAGVWAASTNTPTLDDSDTGVVGKVYYVSDSGTVDFGAGNQVFNAGDKVANNGTTWDKWDMTDSVVSVNGQSGVVSLDTDDISEGSALYFTDERAQDAIGSALLSTDTVTLTYTDGTPSIEADVITQMSITSDASGIKLVNDASSPGNTKYYGTDGSGAKGFFSIPNSGASAGDIIETSFSAANNQASPANVTGLAFASAVVRSFKALVSIEIDATASLFETFELVGINKGSSFDMAISSVGDDSGVTFSITSAGQVRYTSANSAGFVSNNIKFRAITTSV